MRELHAVPNQKTGLGVFRKRRQVCHDHAPLGVRWVGLEVRLCRICDVEEHPNTPAEQGKIIISIRRVRICGEVSASGQIRD